MLLKLAGDKAMHRTHVEQIQTLQDIRAFVAHLQMQLNKYNREGKECWVEIWTIWEEDSVNSDLRMIRSNQATNFG